MISNDILTEEELEALLTPEELEAFKAEQHNSLQHELMLSPAHLLLAFRELEDTVGRLTTRVQQLELQLVQKTDQLEPEILQVVNQVIEMQDLISRSERHREIKPSIFGKLLK
jgi:hypothetical protein